MTIKGQRLLIASMYRSPRDKKFLDNFKVTLDMISHRSNIIILCDLNIDLSRSTNESDIATIRKYKTILNSNKLTNVIKDFTRITSSSKTLIDHALVTDTSKVVTSGTYDPCISDHSLIYTVLRLKPPRQAPRFKISRNYRNVDWDKVREDMSQVPWWITSVFDDIDDTVWAWQTMYENVVNEHIRSRQVKIRAQSHPWMNSELRKQMNQRYKLLRKAQKTNKGSPEWIAYKSARNLCTFALRRAKSRYWKDKFDNSNSSKEFWSLVKSFQGKRVNSKLGSIKDAEGNMITNDSQKANILNNFFATIGNKMAEKHLPFNSKQPDNSLIYRVTPTCSEIKIIEQDLSIQFKKLTKPGKAAGLDKIQSKDLYMIGDTALDSLKYVIKKSISSLQIPSIWKKSQVSCLHKKGPKHNCENYRPISLLSIPSKIMESIICKSLDDHLQNHSLLNERQWGFRKKRSTQLSFLHMTESWRKHLDDNRYVEIFFLDFLKAFDSVNHQVIEKKLSSCGISGDLFVWIKNYLSDRQQLTTVNGQSSNYENVDTGVPQGSLLGPRLFSVSVNDLPDQSENYETDLFADDTTSACISYTIDELMIKVQEMVNELSSWSHKNGLTIHPKKSIILILSPKSFIGPIPQIVLDEQPLSTATKKLSVFV